MFAASLRSLCPVLFSGLALAVEPVARWDFDASEADKLALVGGVHLEQPGPRPPEFPDFDRRNNAATFDGAGARLICDDPGAGSVFDFTNGDSITLEAWVNIAELGNGREPVHHREGSHPPRRLFADQSELGAARP